MTDHDPTKVLKLAKGERVSIRVEYSDEDDAVLVSGIDLQAAESPSPLRESHPELFGRILAVSDAISSAGGLIVKVLWLGAGLLFAAIGLEWIEKLGSYRLSHLAGFWGGLLIICLTMFIANRVGAVCEALAWAKHRTELLRAINDAGLELPTLVALLEHDAKASEVADRLKKELRSSRF